MRGILDPPFCPSLCSLRRHDDSRMTGKGFSALRRPAKPLWQYLRVDGLKKPLFYHPKTIVYQLGRTYILGMGFVEDLRRQLLEYARKADRSSARLKRSILEETELSQTLLVPLDQVGNDQEDDEVPSPRPRPVAEQA